MADETVVDALHYHAPDGTVAAVVFVTRPINISMMTLVGFSSTGNVGSTMCTPAAWNLRAGILAATVAPGAAVCPSGTVPVEIDFALADLVGADLEVVRRAWVAYDVAVAAPALVDELTEWLAAETT